MKKLIYIILVSLLISCTNTEKENYAQIKGKIKSGGVEGIEIEWLKDNPINEMGAYYLAQVDSQSNFNLEISIKGLAIGKITAGEFSHEICLLPGDQIYIEINGKASKYEGKGSLKNNFLYELEKKELASKAISMQSYEKDFTLDEYLSFISEISDKRIALMDSFNLKGELDSYFIEYFKIENKVFCEGRIQYYPRLFSYKNKVDLDRLKLPEQYLKSYQLNFIVNDNKNISPNYLYNIKTAINKLASKLVKENSTLNYEDTQFSILTDSLKGKTKEYALAQYICNQLSYKNVYDSIAIEYFNELENDDVSGKEVQNAIVIYNKKQDLIGKELCNEFAQTKLLDTVNVQLSFAEMMNKYKGNVVYLDMWSLGCGPCRMAMPHSNKLKEKLAEEPIEFVYVTVDDYSNETCKSLFEVSLTNENHYFFKFGFNSKIHEFMGINWVPNYMIFDKKGQLVDYRADRPTVEDKNGESDLEKELRKLAEE